MADVARELSAVRSGGGGDSSHAKHPLPALPKSTTVLPSVKAWRARLQTKLFGWCGLHADGFADAVREVLVDPHLDLGPVHNSPHFARV